MYISSKAGTSQLEISRAGDQEVGHDKLNYLRPNYIVTDEPGFYLSGKFGMRIENAVIVSNEPVKVKHEGLFPKKFYGFEPLIFLPYERQLIDVDLLSESEIDWLNWYNSETKKRLEEDMDDELALDWVRKNTETIARN